MMQEIKSRLDTLEIGHNKVIDKMKEIDARLTDIEGIGDNVEEILNTVNKVSSWIKRGMPSIVAAAIAAGLVNGKLGAFLNALVTGYP